MYSTPAVVTTSRSWVVYIRARPPPQPRAARASLLELRALVARVYEPEALQHLRLAVGLHLRQVDGERRVVLLVHLDRPARPLEHDAGLDLGHLLGVGRPRLLDSHRVGVDAVVLRLGQ